MIGLLNQALFGKMLWVEKVSCFYNVFGILTTQMLQNQDCRKSLFWWIISIKPWVPLIARRICLSMKAWSYGEVVWSLGYISKEKDINMESSSLSFVNQPIWSWDRLTIYSGTSYPDPKDFGQTGAIFMNLMSSYPGKDTPYIWLIMKNAYISCTLQSDRKGNPKQVVKPKLKKGETTLRKVGAVAVWMWKDSRNVLTISNKHLAKVVDVKNKRGKICQKPYIITDHNNKVSGIDWSDQMFSYYQGLKKVCLVVQKDRILLFRNVHFQWPLAAYKICRWPCLSRITSCINMTFSFETFVIEIECFQTIIVNSRQNSKWVL